MIRLDERSECVYVQGQSRATCQTISPIADMEIDVGGDY